MENPFALQREALRREIEHSGIARAPSGSQELPSIDGKGHYGWQFYLRGPLFKGEHLDFVARSFWAINYQRFTEAPFQIAGVEAAAAPIMAAIVLRAHFNHVDINAFTIRKERKKYGLQNLIEGKPLPLPVMLIDDLTSTGHTAMWHAVGALRDAKLMVYPRCFVVVFKGLKNEAPRILKTSLGEIAIEALYSLDDFTLSYEEWNHASTS